MKHKLLVTAALTSVVTVVPPVMKADTVVATINGFYDVDSYDTPSLHVDNSSAYNFTNVQLTLTGYPGLNNGISQSVGLADITAGSTAIITWGSIPGVSGSTTAKNLFAYDYDDEYSGTFTPKTGYGLSASGNLVLAPQCTPQASVYGWNYCADVGNFYVTFTAKWNGESVYSQFSPDPTLKGAGNAAGVYVGWEGIDPNGWSETTYDSHSSGGPHGVLADIFVGTPPPVGATPEPASILLMGGGLLGVAGFYRRKVRRSYNCAYPAKNDRRVGLGNGTGHDMSPTWSYAQKLINPIPELAAN